MMEYKSNESDTYELPLIPYDATQTTTLSPPLHPLISTLSISTTTIVTAHGGLISNYHPTSLTHLSTIRTHLDHISSMSSLSSTISAVSSNSFSQPPGLHIFNSDEYVSHVGSILWSDPSDPRTDKSRVTAIDAGSNRIFASFDCRHRENAVLVADNSTLQVISEICRQSGNSAKSAALTKLRWVPNLGLLIGSSVSGGAFGYSGYIRVWDIRTGNQVWETGEPGGTGRSNRLGDAMADVDVDIEGVYIAKVGSRSGEVGVADMRRLGDNPWMYLEEPNPGLRNVGPVKENVVVHCWKQHIFVARDGAMEAWSTVNSSGGEGGGEILWGRYRKNYMDKEDEKRGIVRTIGGGGNRLFVVREDVEGVEVWESSRLSGVITVL